MTSHTKIFVGNPECGRGRLSHLGVDARTQIRLTLNKQRVKVWSGLTL